MTKKRYCWFVACILAFAACFGLVACADPPEHSEPGAEAGEYYYETAESAEYTLTLGENGSASLNVGQKLTGTYALNGNELTLTLGEEVIDAEYRETSISLTYSGEEMEFLKKIYFTVTFETNGGTAIESEQVLNGKTAQKPADPQKTNGKFLGWYKDAGGNTPFDFTAEKITANTTVYAKWNTVNTLTYDAESGVSGSFIVSDGEDYKLETPEKEYGYVFLGWYTEDGTQLTDGAGNSLAAWDSSEYGNITVYARTEADLVYTLTADETGYSVSGKAESSEVEELIIPAVHEGKPVTQVMSFAGYAALTAVQIPDSVAELAEWAFSDAGKLSSVEFYETGTNEPAYISENGVVFSADKQKLILYPAARQGDGGTSSYRIPASVTEIAPYAFADVRTIPDGEWTPVYAGVLTEVILPQNLQTIGDHAFYQRGKLESALFDGGKSPSEWTVGDYAFYGTPLKDFDFNDNLVRIGNSAFYSDYANPSQLSEVVFSENSKLQSIGDSAFYFVASLQRAVLPASLTQLGEAAFYNCRNATDLQFAQGSRLSSIPDDAFAQWAFTEVELPETVTSIGAYAFGSSSLQKVILSENLISIGAEAFLSCEELEEITMPSSLKTIGTDAFSGCTALKKVVLNDGLETIGDNAFVTEEYDKYTQELTINIPSSVTAMGKGMLASQKPIAELKVDNAAFLSAASESDWFDSVNVLLLAEGLSLPAAQGDDFVLVEDAAEEGYAFYVNRNIKVRTQTYLDEIASQAWISQIDTLLIEENLTVPQSISGTFTKGDALVEEWYCNYVKYLKTTV